MKKILSILCAAMMVLGLTACGAESQHTISYVSGEKVNVADTQYTNGSDETAIPADYVTVKAFQNGTEIPCIVPTGEKTNGYIQCDSSVQSGVTADVVWLFQLNDDSTVSVEFSDGTKVEIPLSEK